MVFNFSIKSKILINFVELFDSKTPQRSLHSSFADFILFIKYFHLSFFVCVLLLLAIKSVCLSVCVFDEIKNQYQISCYSHCIVLKQVSMAHLHLIAPFGNTAPYLGMFISEYLHILE